MGLAADVGTLQRLPSIVGHGVATEMSLTARVVGAEEAVATGLCSRAHPDATAMLVAARKLCASIAAKRCARALSVVDVRVRAHVRVLVCMRRRARVSVRDSVRTRAWHAASNEPARSTIPLARALARAARAALARRAYTSMLTHTPRPRAHTHSHLHLSARSRSRAPSGCSCACATAAP